MARRTKKQHDFSATLSPSEREAYLLMLGQKPLLVTQLRKEMKAENFKRVLNLPIEDRNAILEQGLGPAAVRLFLRENETIRAMLKQMTLHDPREVAQLSESLDVRTMLKQMTSHDPREVAPLPELLDEDELEMREFLEDLEKTLPTEPQIELDPTIVWVKGYLPGNKLVYYPLDWSRAELVAFGKKKLQKIQFRVTSNLVLLLPNKKKKRQSTLRVKYKDKDSILVRKVTLLDKDQVIEELPQLFSISAAKFFRIFRGTKKPLAQGMGVAFVTAQGSAKTSLVRNVGHNRELRKWRLTGSDEKRMVFTLTRDNKVEGAAAGAVFFFPVPKFLPTVDNPEVYQTMGKLRSQASAKTNQELETLRGSFVDIGWLQRAEEELQRQNVQGYQKIAVPIRTIFNPALTQRVIAKFPNGGSAVIFVSEYEHTIRENKEFKIRVNPLVQFTFVRHPKYADRYQISVNGLDVNHLQPATGKYLQPDRKTHKGRGAKKPKKPTKQWFSIRFDDTLPPLLDLSFGNYLGIGNSDQPDAHIFPLVNVEQIGEAVFSADMLRDTLMVSQKIILDYVANHVTVKNTGETLFDQVYLYYPIRYTKWLAWPDGELLNKFLDWWHQHAAEARLAAERWCEDNPVSAGCLVKRTLAVSQLLEKFNRLSKREKRNIKSRSELEQEAEAEITRQQEEQAREKKKREGKVLRSARAGPLTEYAQARKNIIKYVLRENPHVRFSTLKPKALSLLPQPLQDFDNLLVSFPNSIVRIGGTPECVGVIRSGLKQWAAAGTFDKLWFKYKAFFDTPPGLSFDDLWADQHLVDETYHLYFNLNMAYLLHQYYPSLGVHFSDTELARIEHQLLPFLQARWAIKTRFPRKPTDPMTGITEEDDLFIEEEDKKRRARYRERKVKRHPELLEKYHQQLKRYVAQKKKVQAFGLSYLLAYLISDDYKRQPWVNIFSAATALRRPMLKRGRTKHQFYSKRDWQVLAFEEYFKTYRDPTPSCHLPLLGPAPSIEATLRQYVRLWTSHEE